MEYIVCLKWGGLGDITLQRASGELVYVLKRQGFRSALFTVVDGNGKEVLHVEKARRGLGSTYLMAHCRDALGFAKHLRMDYPSTRARKALGTTRASCQRIHSGSRPSGIHSDSVHS